MPSSISESQKRQLFKLNLLLVIANNHVSSLVNKNPMQSGEERAEGLSDIWAFLDSKVRYTVPQGRRIDQPEQPGGPEYMEPGHVNKDCDLDDILTENPTTGDFYPTYFKKLRMAPGTIRASEQRDNAPIYLFTATKESVNGVAERRPGGALVDNALNLYDGQLAVAICRRRKIEVVKINKEYNGEGCSIDTWLAFLCFIDEDVQRNEFRDSNPDDYEPYLGNLPESRHLINMARLDCRNIIGVTPKNHKLTKGGHINTDASNAIEMFIVASQAAEFDYVMLKRKQGRKKNEDCGPPFVIRMNNKNLYQQASKSSPIASGSRTRGLRNEYENQWLFCKHGTGNIRSPLRPHVIGRRKPDINAIPPSYEPVP